VPVLNGRLAVSTRSRVRWFRWGAGAVVIIGAVWFTEVWNSPPEWFRPAHVVTVRVLHWGEHHWLTAAVFTALASGVTAVAPFVLRIAEERSARQDREDVRLRDGAAMIKRVRYKWITGVLKSSLEDAALLVLGISQRNDVLDLGGITRRSPGSAPRPLAVGVAISEVFDQIGGGHADYWQTRCRKDHLAPPAR
jgi:hypothetical protein